MQELIECPNCDSDKVVKNGFVMRKNGKKQRYRCNNCGHVFNEE